MRVHRVLTSLAVAAVLVAVPLDEPAGASVTLTTAGTTVHVTASGDETLRFGCSGGTTTVNGVATSPAAPCATLTSVAVNGDGGNQRVEGQGLDDAVFAANPSLQVSLGDGSDVVLETDRADSLDLGLGDDFLALYAGGLANLSNNLGGGSSDYLSVQGTSKSDAVVATSAGTSVSVSVSNEDGGSTRTATNAENLSVSANSGDDAITATGIVGASSLTYISLEGGPGNDTFQASAKGVTAYGGPGTNTFNGGIGNDIFWSTSTTDDIRLGGGTANRVYDADSLRSGGRTISGPTTTDYLTTQVDGRDTVARIRRGAATGTAILTVSLNRTGQQQVPANVGNISVNFNYSGETPDRSLADVVVPRSDVNLSGDPSDDDLFDITIPTGTFTTSFVPGGGSAIETASPAVGRVTISNTGALSVHAPWTSTYESFGHRVIRDLQFRFATAGERLAIRNGLAASTLTRPQVVADLMDTDVYRGIDVDRVFESFLDRQPDPSGRTYWINALRGGRSLRKFRAQLFGSNEYFTKSGGNDEAYVRAAYADVLGRQPDPAGLTYWVNKIGNGTGRGVVAEQFLSSTEARRNIVEDQFLRFIDRLPTPAESSAWVSTLGSASQGEQQLIAFLATSNAYYLRDVPAAL